MMIDARMQDYSVVIAMVDLLSTPLRAELRRYASDPGTVSLAATNEAWLAIPPYARARFQIVNGTLYKAPARCVYRRDETMAWALLQMIERHPDQPDTDVVFNCRDGPLLRRRWASKSGQRPMVFTFSTDDDHAELAFPDYTLWGLPGKLKPWAQLRLDLLHRAQLPWAERDPRLFASGVVNSYHASVGVRTRERLWQCSGHPRLSLHFHRLYYERFYSTEEHCAHRYVLLAPGSHAPWLDHMKQKMLCGSLVFFLEADEGQTLQQQRPRPFCGDDDADATAATTDRGRRLQRRRRQRLQQQEQRQQRRQQPQTPQLQQRRCMRRPQYDVLTRLLVPGVHYVSVPLPPPERNICTALAEAVSWADAHPRTARAIARAGRALVRDEMSMRQIYGYMSEALRGAGALLSYDAALGVAASNASVVPAHSADAFVAAMRNDTSYPVTSQIRATDWADVVLRYNYSSMGASFRASAAYLRQVVAEINAKRREEEEARKAKVAAERKRQRGRGGGGGGRRRGRGGGGRGGRGRPRQ